MWIRSRALAAALSLWLAGLATSQTITPQVGGGISNGFDGGISAVSGAGGGAPAWVLPGAVAAINMLHSAQNNWQDSTRWAYSNVQDTTFATKTLAPDGTNTAEKLIANSTNSFHTINSANIARTARVQSYRVAVDAKPAGYDRVVISLDDVGSNGSFLVCDLAGGQTVGPTNYGTVATGANPVITPIGSGFYRCYFDVTTNAVATIRFQVALDNGSGTAAVSNSFAGNGVNGVYVWQANVLPTPAWTLVNNTFNDPMTSTSTVDMSNAKTAGFNWYINNAWPNAGDGGSLSLPWRNASQTTSGTITSDGTKITLAKNTTNQSGIGEGLVSAVTDGSTGYVGKAFTLPYLIDFNMAFDPTLATTTAYSWPVAWTLATEYLTGSATHFLESDWFEAFPSGSGTVVLDSTVHDWTINGGSSTNITNTGNTFTFPTLTLTNLNRFSVLHLSAASNGGVGLKQLFWSGGYQGASEITYTAAGTALPGATPSNPVGTFSVEDTEHFPIILTAGTGAANVGNWPTSYANVRVFQKAVPNP